MSEFSIDTKKTHHMVIRDQFSKNLKQEDFDELQKLFEPNEIITSLFNIFENKKIKLANKISNIKFKSSKFKGSKNIGIYYPFLKQGGVERVISLQVPLFKKLGYHVILFLEEYNPDQEFTFSVDAPIIIIPKSYQQDRAHIFEKALIENEIEAVIHHAAWSPNLFFDTLLIKTLGIRLIQQRHELFSLPLLYNSSPEEISAISKIHAHDDVLLVLTRMDELLFRLLGCNNCFYLPNIVQFADVKSDYAPDEDLILWIGRLERNQKNFPDALEIAKRVISKKPNAKLVMLGREENPDAVNYMNNFIKINSLQNNIEWPGAVSDIPSYLKKAKVFLVTSLFEAFPMIITESKSFGIPLITYSMPYLEMLQDKRGYIEIPQGDIQSASDAIISLLDNPILCKKLSDQAKETLNPFKAFNHEAAWNAILSGISLPFNDYSSEKQQELMQQQIDVINLFANRSHKVNNSYEIPKIEENTQSQEFPKTVPQTNSTRKLRKFKISEYIKYKITSKITFGNTRARHKKKYQKLKRALRNTSVQ